jgi:hypothetical protein
MWRGVQRPQRATSLSNKNPRPVRGSQLKSIKAYFILIVKGRINMTYLKFLFGIGITVCGFLLLTGAATPCRQGCFLIDCMRGPYQNDTDFAGVQFDTPVARIVSKAGEPEGGTPVVDQTVKRRSAQYSQQCPGSVIVGNAYAGTGQCTSNANWADTSGKKECEKKLDNIY